MRTGLLQFFIVVSLSLIGLKAAGQQSSQLNNQAEDIGCIFMTANKDFDGLKRQLERRGSTVEQFFHYGRCQNETSYEYIEMPTVSPFQMVLQKPLDRAMLAVQLMTYLSNSGSRSETEILEVLNYRDQKGRTMLDYLNFQYISTYAQNGSAINFLGLIKDQMCRHGATAEPEAMQLCDHESLPGASKAYSDESLTVEEWAAN